jgi:hypothetical protein
MLKNRKALLTVACIAVAAATVFAYLHWRSRDSEASRTQLLSLMPPNGNLALFLDLSQLRASPFLAELFALAPQPGPEGDYAEFLQATGFNYERDLERIAISIDREPQTQTVFAVAEGRFDRKKIEAYGAQFGALKTADGKTLYAVPVQHSARKVYFSFLRDDRVAWANDLSGFFQTAAKAYSADWREHFSRVAGTPVFVILRQDAGAASALSGAPGGLRSPQLATLVSQLQWISIGAKPEGDLLRVVLDGEAPNENAVHQLKEVLSGLVMMAQAGLNDGKMRKQLDPDLREGYLELLNSADIEQMDRGTSKSVRVIFDVTPKLLRSAARKESAAAPGGAHAR